jgi:hypothetical protein
MKLHARFPTVLRGVQVDAEISGEFNPPRVDMEVWFYNDGVKYQVADLTRTELAYLCREAARAKSS